MTKRQRAARAELVDKATEVACVIGSSPQVGEQLDSEDVEALRYLYKANDEWQRSLLSKEERDLEDAENRERADG